MQWENNDAGPWPKVLFSHTLSEVADLHSRSFLDQADFWFSFAKLFPF